MRYESWSSSSYGFGSALQPSRGGCGIALFGDGARIALQGLESRSFVVAPESQIEDVFPDLEISNGELREPHGQSGIDVELASRRVGLKADDHLKHGETRSRCPGLWHIGAEVLNRKVGGITLHARIEFRHLVAHEVAGRAADVAGDAVRLFDESIAAKAQCDDAVVVRPYCAVLVGMRIVGGVVGRKRPYAPAPPHARFHQPLDHLRGAIGRHDARPQTLAGVGGDAQHLLFVAIEAESVEA